jgi:hypothetical protein
MLMSVEEEELRILAFVEHEDRVKQLVHVDSGGARICARYISYWDM